MSADVRTRHQDAATCVATSTTATLRTDTPRSTVMNLLHEQLARAQCQADQQEAERARVARALRANRRLQRAALAARRAEHRVTLRYA